MISLFLVSTIACYTNFDELANALTAGKYYSISYTPGTGAAWAATEIATTDITTATKRTYCTDADTCADISAFPAQLKYGYTFGANSKCKDKSAAEIAAAYLYGLHTAVKPSLYYIAGCAEDGKDFETTTTTHTAGKCATQTTHPLSALQGIVDKYPLKDACYPIQTEATAVPTCAKPETGCDDETVYGKYQAVFKLGYANKIDLDAVKTHIHNYGPIIMKLYLEAEADLTAATKFNVADGIYCAKADVTTEEVKSEWVEVVGYGSAEKTFTAAELYCGDEQAELTVAETMPFLVARSQYDIEYFTGKDHTFFKVPLFFENGDFVLTNPLKDSTTGTATYSGFFLYTSKFTLPTGTTKKIASIDNATKIVKFDEFTEASYVKLQAGKETNPAFSLWTDEEIKANTQASQLHSTTSNQVATSKFVIDAVYLTAKLHGETLTGLASVAGTVGTVASAIGFGDNVNFMEKDTATKKYIPANIDTFFPLGLSEQGLVLASCLSEKAADIYAYDTTDCETSGNAAVTRVGSGLKTLVISEATEADLKKAVAYYGPVVATFLIGADDMATHLNGRTTETVDNPLVVAVTTDKMTVLVVGWGEYTPEGSNAAHTKWYVKVNSPTCTNCEPTGEGKFGTFTYITGASAAPLPNGYIYTFVKAKGVEPGPDAALSFLPPLKPLVFIASLLFLLL